LPPPMPAAADASGGDGGGGAPAVAGGGRSGLNISVISRGRSPQSVLPRSRPVAAGTAASGGSPIRARASSASSGGGDGHLSEAAFRKIWQRLDRNNSGVIQVKDIVANASFIQQECPKLLQQYGKIARGGQVKSQDVRRLLLGLLDGQRTAGQHGGASQASVRMSDDEMLRLFELLKDAEGMITVQKIVEHKEVVLQRCPAMVHDFEKIDLDKDSKLSWDELKVFNGGTAEWLEHQLDGIVGLEELKAQVRSFYRSVMLDRTRRNLGHAVQGMAKAPHMIFQGSPGTGKTSLGRIMANLLHRIGVTSSPELKEVQRPELVAEHVGQTGPKTQAVLTAAKAGVLFIDEAYRLTSTESKNDFGREAVETLMAAMNEQPGKAPVMIFAGYTGDMEKFMCANEGLYRRIGYTFDFKDYSPRNLAQILELLVGGKGFKLERSLLEDDRTALAALIEQNTVQRARSLMNGGLCERLFDLAKQQLDARDDPERPTVEIGAEDLITACRNLPPPPDRGNSPHFHAAGPAAALDASSLSAVALQELRGVASEGFDKGLPPVSRNVWFHILACDGLRHARGCFRPISGYFVIVRFNRTEVHRTACSSPCGGSPVFRETRIIPYSGETLVEFVVMRQTSWAGPAFVGSAALALSGWEVFDGCLDLRASDRPVGQLQVQVGWQMLASVTGHHLFTEAVGAATKVALAPPATKVET